MGSACIKAACKLVDEIDPRARQLFSSAGQITSLLVSQQRNLGEKDKLKAPNLAFVGHDVGRMWALDCQALFAYLQQYFPLVFSYKNT